MDIKTEWPEGMEQECAINLSLKNKPVENLDVKREVKVEPHLYVKCTYDGDNDNVVQAPIESVFVKVEPDTSVFDNEYDGGDSVEDSMVTTDKNVTEQVIKHEKIDEDGYDDGYCRTDYEETVNCGDDKSNLEHVPPHFSANDIVKQEITHNDDDDDSSINCDDIVIHENDETDLEHASVNEGSDDVHDNSTGGKKKYSCAVCGKCVTRPYDLKRHMKTHTGLKPYSCEICGKSFAEQGNLQKHMRIHTGEKPYHCEICNNSFKQLGHLQGHMLTHSGKKPYSCNVCNKAFREKKSLRYHSKLHENQDPNDLSIYMRKKINGKQNVIRIGTKTVDEQFICLICNKQFKHHRNLKRHVMKHGDGDKEYICDICKHSFRNQAILEKHCKMHTRDVPYICDICDRRFSQLDNLRTHMRTHTGEKPFLCSVCGKKFSHKYTLEVHTRIHTGLKPFTCNVCNNNFRHLSNLKQHMRTHLNSF